MPSPPLHLPRLCAPCQRRVVGKPSCMRWMARGFAMGPAVPFRLTSNGSGAIRLLRGGSGPLLLQGFSFCYFWVSGN